MHPFKPDARSNVSWWSATTEHCNIDKSSGSTSIRNSREIAQTGPTSETFAISFLQRSRCLFKSKVLSAQFPSRVARKCTTIEYNINRSLAAFRLVRAYKWSRDFVYESIIYYIILYIYILYNILYKLRWDIFFCKWNLYGWTILFYTSYKSSIVVLRIENIISGEIRVPFIL